MAKYNANQTRVYFGGYGAGTATTRWELSLATQALDPTAYGDSGERVIGGIRGDTVVWTGLFDDSTSMEAAGSALMGGTHAPVITVVLGSASEGLGTVFGYCATGTIVSVKPSANIRDLARLEVEVRLAQSWDRVRVLSNGTNHPPAGSAHDNGASSTGGLTVYAHWLSFTGTQTGSRGLDVQHSTDGTTYSSFGTYLFTSTAAPQALRGTGTGTVQRYVRIFTVGTIGTGTMALVTAYRRG